MSPLVFACEAGLQLSVVQGFVERGVLGSEDTYVQRVYSGDDVSYSTLMFPSTTPFNRKNVIQQTAKSMMSTVSAADKFSSPQVQVLNKSLLPKIDDRRLFLSYLTHG